MNQDNYLTVTALNKYLKRKFDGDPYLKMVYVVGEISNFRKRPSHQYFSLKDDKAKIKAVCFQQHFRKLDFDLKEGQKVLAVGYVGLYEQSGEYQLYIEQMALAGVGNLYQQLKALDEKLTQEGLFNKPKKPIPMFPKKIAILTSQSGAVIHDIQTTVLRRYPLVALHVYPTVVQGKASADSIVANLARVKARAEDYDTVIIARGGGSIEDLWSFNEEKVIRALADFPLPVISSIGHDTDHTLTDKIADLRVPTPTAAAECATPVLQEVLAYLSSQEGRLQQRMQDHLNRSKKALDKTLQSYIFQQSDRLYDSYLLKLDHLVQRLEAGGQYLLAKGRQDLEKSQWALQMHSPLKTIDNQALAVQAARDKLTTRMQAILQGQRATLDLKIKGLDLLSPLQQMTRGYSLVTKEDKLVTSVGDLSVGDQLTIDLIDGQAQVAVTARKEIDRRNGN